jgi:hypothetical protein
MENNFVIDYAKTLYKPERPKHIHEKITAFTKGNVPHFFTYAKDKLDTQVEELNKSFVNKLDYKIVNPRINSRSVGLKKIDYKKMVNNPDIECRVAFNKNGKINEELSDPMIAKYCELNQRYHFKINLESIDVLRDGLMSSSQLKQELLFNNIANEIRTELSQFGYSESEVADILVKFLYHTKPSKHKAALWFCYGKYIVENLKNNNCKLNTKVIQCIDCGEWINVDIFDSATCRCHDCLQDHKKMLRREQNKRAYEKKKNSVATL